MNAKDARDLAASKGLKVTAVRTYGERRGTHTTCDTPREFFVGSLRLYHDAKGGAACWRIDGRPEFGRGYVSEMIVKAAHAQP